MNTQTIISWLRETDPARLGELWESADETRRAHVGGAVHLRGLIEISSHCTRRCEYCGLRADRRELSRYRMTVDEILDCQAQARSMGCGTVVLQAGEDAALTGGWVTALVTRLRAAAPEMAITLSLGERTDDELRAWRAAGADRYLLRFETSNRDLYDRIHPPRAVPVRAASASASSVSSSSAAAQQQPKQQQDAGKMPAALAARTGTSLNGQSDRVAILRSLRVLGYQVGSGVMIGIPGQTYEDLARDIELFGELKLDMIGVGPFLAHPDTPLGRQAASAEPATGEQVPASEEMTYKMIALARLMCPWANIPSTTALATLNKTDGRELGLRRGANVVMPNVTPVKYRRLYDIYPNKACIAEQPSDCMTCLKRRIAAEGRTVGAGRGDTQMGTGSVLSRPSLATKRACTHLPGTGEEPK